MKYDPQKTVKLAELREAAQLTQDQAAAYFGLKGKKRRDTVGNWERGHSRPGLKHRTRFISYLWDKLGLRRNKKLFLEIWQEVAVTEWGWSLLGEGELPRSLTAPPKPNNPPAALSGPFLAPPRPPYELVGRSNLLQTIKQKLMHPNRRPVALTGLPGAGKTALALALAYDREILAHFPDGVLWAGLGVKPGIGALLRKWGDALDIPRPKIAAAAAINQISQQLHEAAGKRRLLLIIDDAWRLEDALPFQIGGPNCAILLTTRRPGLAQDFAEDNVIIAPELDKAGGIVLFTQFAPRVAAAMPAAVESLVTAVGGLPLALKLMARHARKQNRRHISLEQTLRQMRDAQKRLTLSQIQQPAHPHPSLPSGAFLSLSATLQISLESIDEQSRQGLRALSVFPPKPNTFSVAAAQEICAVSHRTLAALVDDGLVEPSGKARYAIHQTIWDFIRPAGKQAAQETRIRFAAYYKIVLQQARCLYEQGGGKVQQGLALFDREMNNIRAGWQWVKNGRLADETTARLCAEYPVAGGFLLHLRLLPQENSDWWETSLNAARQIGDQKLTAQNLTNLGLVYRQMGRTQEAIACYQEALSLFTNLADEKNQIRVLNNTGVACKTLGEFQEAITYHEQALSLARQTGDREQEGDAIANLGVIYKNLRQYDKAIEYQKKALDIARELGHQYGQMTSLLDLGAACSEKGDQTQAIEFYQEALNQIRILGDKEHEGTVLCNLGVASLYMGDIIQAIDYYCQALEIDMAMANRPGELITRYNLGEAYEALGEYDTALQYYNQSLAMAQETGDQLGQGEALWRSARILERGNRPEAERCARQARDIFIRIGDSRTAEISDWLTRFQRRPQPHQSSVSFGTAKGN